MPIRSIQKRMIVLLAVLGAISYFLLSPPFASSFLFGGGLALFNFRLLAKGVRGWISQAEGQGTAPAVSFFVLKYPLLLAVIGFTVLKLKVQVEAFVAGILCLVFAIVLEGLFPTKTVEFNS